MTLNYLSLFLIVLLLFTNKMDLIYAFSKESGLVFEIVTDEGDNVYWAAINGGIPLEPSEILCILNGRYTAEEMVGSIWKKMYPRD